MNPDDLIKILQGSIAPTVLISGVGLLLLSMTNRLSRPIDRIRALCKDIKENKAADPTQIYEQISILYRRCKYLQASIVLSTVSIICVSVIILALFSMFVFRMDLIPLVELFFTLGLISLIVSLVFFVQDISLGLNSVKIEIELTKGRKG